MILLLNLFSSLVEETKNIKHTLTEARLESETLELEKKQLMQNWNSCLIGIRRRDEAQGTMNDAVRFEISGFFFVMN